MSVNRPHPNLNLKSDASASDGPSVTGDVPQLVATIRTCCSPEANLLHMAPTGVVTSHLPSEYLYKPGGNMQTQHLEMTQVLQWRCHLVLHKTV